MIGSAWCENRTGVIIIVLQLLDVTERRIAASRPIASHGMVTGQVGIVFGGRKNACGVCVALRVAGN